MNLEVDTIRNVVDIGLSSTTEHKESHRFIYDHVFNHNSKQEEIFNQVAKNAVDCVAEGYNATIFTYGATSTGKTFTMFGHESGNRDQRGIIPRSCEHLFHTLNENEDVMEANVKCSFLEIYREYIRDLLATHSKDEIVPSLRIRQHQKKGNYVQGLIEKYVYTPQEILDTIKEGARQRSTASTALNNVSSRSHAVLTLTVTQILTDGTEIVSKMHMIDLAGSENVGRSEVQGTTLLEAQQINKSLSALGNVIYALTEKGRGHIPYRDSRLTYLLQDSLGGNSKTILITTVSPHIDSYSETINTLKFAKRTKEIKNIPKVNRNESNANLIKTVAMLTSKLGELQSKYDDAKAVVDRVEKEEAPDDSKMVTVLKTRVERLEANISNMKKEQQEESQRRKQSKKIFDKQRKLAQSIAIELYKERMKVCSITNELEQYKSFYDSMKDAVDLGGEVLELMVKNANIKVSKTLLNVDTLRNIPIVEIDSPT